MKRGRTRWILTVLALVPVGIKPAARLDCAVLRVVAGEESWVDGGDGNQHWDCEGYEEILTASKRVEFVEAQAELAQAGKELRLDVAVDRVVF